mgnify:CR=1 FL=1
MWKNIYKRDACYRQPNPYSRVFNVAETPLSKLFFAEENVNNQRYLLRERIIKKYNVDIGLQPYRATEFFMIKVFQDISCDMCQSKSLEDGLNILNKYSSDGLLERVSRNLGHQIGYLRFMDNASWGYVLNNPLKTDMTNKTLETRYNCSPNELEIYPKSYY